MATYVQQVAGQASVRTLSQHHQPGRMKVKYLTTEGAGLWKGTKTLKPYRQTDRPVPRCSVPGAVAHVQRPTVTHAPVHAVEGGAPRAPAVAR